MRLPWQRREHECESRSRLVVACAEMGRQAADGSQYVLIARVLRILDPERKLAVPPPPLPPGADPLFGTLPVTAEPPETAGQ